MFTKLALTNLKTIFPRMKVDTFLRSRLIGSVNAITKISKTNYHIIFEVNRKRAFIDCYKYDKPFVAISVEEL